MLTRGNFHPGKIILTETTHFSAWKVDTAVPWYSIIRMQEVSQ